MATEYAVMGARLECDKGTAPSQLVILPKNRCTTNGKFKASINDCIPYKNVMPFGLCTSAANPGVIAAGGAPVPCTPTCAVWLGGKPDKSIGNIPALLVGDVAVCPLGAGIIEVKDSGQEGGIEELPPELRDEVERLINDPSLSDSEKADRILGVYEKYMLSIDPEAFAEYDKAKKLLAGKYSAEVEAKLHRALSKHNLDLNKLMDNAGQDIFRVTGSAKGALLGSKAVVAVDMYKFIDLVNTGRPLDLKNRSVGKMTGTDYTWSIWSCQWNSADPNNLRSHSDYCGNYLFGSFGMKYYKYYPAKRTILFTGASFAQGGIDNKDDPKMIADGMGSDSNKIKKK